VPIRHGGCHENDIRTDNRLPNLRWDTRSANEHDKVRNGRHHSAKKTRCVNGHEFTLENTIRDQNGHRQCLTCKRERGSAWMREQCRHNPDVVNARTRRYRERNRGAYNQRQRERRRQRKEADEAVVRVAECTTGR
jgi:hypothetical protein